MDDYCDTPAAGCGLRGLIAALAGDGWQVAYTAERPQVQTAQLASPDGLLRMTVDQNTVDGSARVCLGILPGGAGEPAHWRACDSNPSADLWRDAARTAARAARDGAHRATLYPGVVLTRHGWLHTRHRVDERVIEKYTSLTTNRRLTYRHPARAAPALWTITRPETSIGVAVIAAEPYVLPALVLALALDEPEGPST